MFHKNGGAVLRTRPGKCPQQAAKNNKNNRLFMKSTLFFPPKPAVYCLLLPLFLLRNADKASAQGICANLIPNPGFEAYKELTENGSGVLWSNVKEWNNVNLQPTQGAAYTYFHKKSPVATGRLPQTGFATLEAHGGEAVIGFLGWQKKFPDYRVYCSAKLIEPMVPGRTYEVTFHITNGKANLGGYGIDGIGVCFSETPLQQNNSERIDVTPQWISPDVIYDTAWKTITFPFYADKPYAHFTLGNFLPASELTTEAFGPAITAKGPFAFYFLDDISVVYKAPDFAFDIEGDTVVCPGQSTTLSLPLYGQNSYQWSTGETGTSIEVRDTGVYFATVTNVCGTFSDSIEVTDGCATPLIPNCFTPNGDDVNDVFHMLPDPKIEQRSLQVFNRWGEKVFDSLAGKTAWDGTDKGRPVPSDVYVYVLEYVAAGEAGPLRVQGDVTLLR